MITAAQISCLEEALAALDRQERPANISPRLWQAQCAAVLSQLEDLRGQLEEQDRFGYHAKPQRSEEYAPWESAASWPEG